MRKEVIHLSQMLRPYTSPGIQLLTLQNEPFLNPSVRPSDASQEEDYDPDQDVDGGEYEFE